MQTFQFLRTRSASILVAMAVLLLVASVARADPIDPEQIKAILRTTTDEEGGFVTGVVAKVNAGTVPMDMFQSCLLWARKKERHRFQYFKAALMARAADAGISLN
jgi:hypothetical protein